MTNEQENFKSDFYLTSTNCKSIAGLATWYPDTDSQVHDLIDGYRTEPVTYSRMRRFDGKYQDCTVLRKKIGISDNYETILLPGDGTIYSVEMKSVKNKINDTKTDDTDSACVICQDYVKNHVAIPCGHVFSCTRCSQKMENFDERCPICRVPYTQILRVFL
jgi:hypothetical protein